MLPEVIVAIQKMSAEAFDDWVQRPENVENHYEYVGGEVHEVVSDGRSSKISLQVMIFLGQYVMAHDLGDLTGADGGYVVNGERYIPDGAFVSKARVNEDDKIAGYYAYAPDLAIEVLSPTDQPHKMRLKVANYLAAGTTLWLVDPAAKTVEVYAPGQPARLLGQEDMLDGGTLLPGFSLPIKDFLK